MILLSKFLIQSPPYSMYRDSDKHLSGNDVFEGYAIDLIKEVAEILSKFEITFDLGLQKVL